MVGELITLPLRVTGRAVRLWWRAADQTLSLATGAVGYVIERVSLADSPSRETGSGTPAPEASTVHPGRTPAVTPVSAEPPAARAVTPPGRAAPRLAIPAEEPTHVSEEPELVEESADPGAEDGAGPELHIREPWEGYRRMTAREVTARLSGASAAELAAVELYESSNRGRQTILAAVARELRSLENAPQLSGANGSGSQP
jgi:hypothetical protein